MKKIISLLLIAVLAAALLCSCNLDDVAGEIVDSITVKRGVADAESYTNESIGITFNKPADWVFYTDEQIAEIMNISKDLFKDENLLESAEITSVIDFMAVNATTGDNVNLSIENLLASGNGLMTVEEYADASKNILLTQSGLTYTFGNNEKVTVAGEEYLRITAMTTVNGASMTQYMYLRKCGTSMIVFTATSMSGAEPETFEAMFS